MSVLVQNKSKFVEHVDVIDGDGVTDTVTVQPGGRVTLARGWRVTKVGIDRPHLQLTGNDAPVSSLKFQE